VRAEMATSKLAGKRFRLADWYVAMEDGHPSKVIREWYGWVAFDADGAYHPEIGPPENRQPNSDDKVNSTALPTREEHDRIEALLFKSG